MQRLVVTLLAALDAFVAAAISVGAAVVPLALLWITAVSGAGPAALWQATAAVWQLGHGVPLSVTLPTEYLVQAGIDDTAATFTLSLAPLAFLAFTFFFAARSGSRAAQAGAWVTGVVSGVVVFAAASALIALTGAQPLASAALWQAVLFPPLVYLAGALAGAIARAWSDGDDGLIDAVRSRTDALPGIWPEVPGLAVRGAVTALTALVGVSALAFAVAVIVRGTAIVTLAQQGGVDLIGAVMIELGQLVYLPTLIVWTMSYLAGPGFALGAGSTISPVGTHAGVVPGVPVLAALPPSGTVWLLALVLLPIAAGAVAGWVVRSRVADETATIGGHEPWGALLALTGAIALLAGGGAALLAALAGGSIGPGRLAVTGPDPGAVALAVAIEVAVGSGILLLAPRGARDDADRPAPVTLGGSPSAWFDVDGTGRPDPSSTGAGGRDEGSEAPR